MSTSGNDISLIAGTGEVGSAFIKVLSERANVKRVDPPKGIMEIAGGPVEWLHICFPYVDGFAAMVLDYVKNYQPKHIIIHSTVPVGTTASLASIFGNTWVYYAPVRGLHPNIARYLVEFPLWYATPTDGQADRDISTYLAKFGIQTRKAPSISVLEWLKLWETTSYSVSLVMWQEIEEQARRLPGDPAKNITALKSWLFEKRKVYDGDRGAVPIYDLAPGPIGGHCLMPNLELLKPLMSPEFYVWLTSTNNRRKPKPLYDTPELGVSLPSSIIND